MPRPVVVLTEIDGPPAELLAASDRIAAEVGERDGLLLRLRGSVSGGLLLVNVWASEAHRQAALTDERHAAARAASGIEALEGGVRTTVVADARVERFGAPPEPA